MQPCWLWSARSQMARAQAEPRTVDATRLKHWVASTAKNGETTAKGRPASLPSRRLTQKHQTTARATTTRERAQASAIAARAVRSNPMSHRRTRKASMPEVAERKCDVATRNVSDRMLDLDDLNDGHTGLDTAMQRAKVRCPVARSAATQHIRTRNATECEQGSACNRFAQREAIATSGSTRTRPPPSRAATVPRQTTAQYARVCRTVVRFKGRARAMQSRHGK